MPSSLRPEKNHSTLLFSTKDRHCKHLLVPAVCWLTSSAPRKGTASILCYWLGAVAYLFSTEDRHCKHLLVPAECRLTSSAPRTGTARIFWYWLGAVAYLFSTYDRHCKHRLVLAGCCSLPLQHLVRALQVFSGTSSVLATSSAQRMGTASIFWYRLCALCRLKSSALRAGTESILRY